MEQLHNDIKYTLAEQEPLRAVGYKLSIRGKMEERQMMAASFWKALEDDKRLDTLKEFGGGAPILGVSMNFSKGGYDFYVCVQTQEEPREGMEEVLINGGLFAVFQCESAAPDAVRERWADIYNKWFFRSGYGHLGTAEVEVYSAVDPEAPCELRVPVKKLEVKGPPRFTTSKRMRDLFIMTLCAFAFLYFGTSVSDSNSTPLLLGLVGLFIGMGITRYLKKRDAQKEQQKEQQKKSEDKDEEGEK